ncbi:hypothetical protein ACGFYU_01525 [Streptomyces sp. NPDC048337]|uniref:hypothetical protein n=1 Tax=Streptomyces sp. NPDC048337 TaxID=3365535 RepID=UPI0037110B4A
MARNFGNPADAQHRRGWKNGIRAGLLLTVLASAPVLVTSASAAVAAPSSAATVVADGDSDSTPRKSLQNSKGNLTYYIPHTIATPKYPAPPVCEKKPFLPNCGPQW